MAGEFKKVSRNLYRRERKTVDGEWTINYHGRLIDRGGRRRSFALGCDLAAAKADLKILEACNAAGKDFDADEWWQEREKDWRGAPLKSRGKAARDATDKARPNDGKSKPFTFSEWAKLYPLQPSARFKKNNKLKRALENTEVPMIENHLEPFFGPMLITEIEREDLKRYSAHALASNSIRRGKRSTTLIKAGTVANHLSLLRRMLKVAAIEGYRASLPVFDYLINRCENAGRALTIEERQKALAVMPKWLARAFEFATETCLDEGDVIRLTDAMIDWKSREVVPEGGRIKTEVMQRSYLTDRAREILVEIEADKKAGRIVRNVKGLIFTRDDGRPFNSGQVGNAILKARKEIGYFRFKDARHTAKTDWMEKGINQDTAMLGAGHKSLQMHQHYQHPRPGTVAAEFKRKARMNVNTDGNTAAEGDERQSVNS